MKTMKPKRRSLSPFGLRSLPPNPLRSLEELFARTVPLPEDDLARPPALKTFEDIGFLPQHLKKIMIAPANDAPALEEVCGYILRYQMELEEKGLLQAVFSSMEILFHWKTEIFLIDHYDKEYCEKMEWKEEYRDLVLFAKERDVLVGRFFSPFTEQTPGLLAQFVKRWAESDNLDRALHFLDFSAGLTRPTFEHYLLFSHPAFTQILKNKSFLKSLFVKSESLLKKLKSPTWEKDTKRTFGL